MSPALIRQVDEHLRGCLPEGVPPSYREIVDARTEGTGKAKVIRANLVMFDGEPAQIVLTEHKPKRDAAGPFAVPIWSHRWLMDRAVFWEDGAWYRDDADEFKWTPPQVHFVGFCDDRYHAAVRVFGVPDFVHIGYDRRALREIAEGDVVVFADGPHDQEPRAKSFPDIIDGSQIGWRWPQMGGAA